MSKNKMITLGEKLHTGEISPSDERIKKAEQCIAQLFKTEAGREEIASMAMDYLQTMAGHIAGGGSTNQDGKKQEEQARGYADLFGVGN